MPQLNENSPRYPVPAKDSVYRNNYLLSKQFIENRDESQPTAYILEVREDYTPLLSVNKSFFQPWVVIQDKYKKENAVRIPVTVCDTLLQHILTSFKSKNEHSDFDGNGVTNEFSNQAYKGPGCAFGDGTNTDLQDCDAHQLKKNKENLSKAFSMEYLSPIRIVCDTTGCVIEISSRDPMIRAFDNKEETVQENSSTNPVRRWIVSSLVENINSLNSEQVSSNNEERKRPLESRGSVEIHKNLLPQLSAFLSKHFIENTKYILVLFKFLEHKINNKITFCLQILATAHGLVAYFFLNANKVFKILILLLIQSEHVNM